MKTHIIAIGNSKGIRIPKSLLDQTGMDGEIEVVVENSALVIKSVAAPRKGWDSAFCEMAARGDDDLLDAEELPTSWEVAEWHWK